MSTFTESLYINRNTFLVLVAINVGNGPHVLAISTSLIFFAKRCGES
jgi:hypothetical protein